VFFVEPRPEAAFGHAAGALVNIVDNLAASQFITPAIVDRDPVTVAIGTEGAAPVLARRIKADIEERLSPILGTLARLGKAFRPAVEALPPGRARRRFWSRFYEEDGPMAFAEGGEPGVEDALRTLLAKSQEDAAEQGRVMLIGAGPGDPELLTIKARRALHDADVVIHDRLVAPEILELARREAVRIEMGKRPGGPSWSQEQINAEIVRHAARGAVVARLKSGDPTVYGRLDEEMDALDAAGIPFEVVPGITAASAAAAGIKASLTKRRRNSSLRFLTGHDVDGFADQDWKGLARQGATAAIYMGIGGARFFQGRLLMHGAAPETPVSVIENASRPDQRVLATTLGALPETLQAEGIKGPAILFLGLSPRRAGAEAQSPDILAGVQ
ncbi:MAG: siroheme synthase CysG, partial [Pseudomonadota bacterium]